METIARLRSRAEEEGLPYQTLAASVLHMVAKVELKLSGRVLGDHKQMALRARTLGSLGEPPTRETRARSAPEGPEAGTLPIRDNLCFAWFLKNPLI